jgi:hypothetical protein
LSDPRAISFPAPASCRAARTCEPGHRNASGNNTGLRNPSPGPLGRYRRWLAHPSEGGGPCCHCSSWLERLSWCRHLFHRLCRCRGPRSPAGPGRRPTPPTRRRGGGGHGLDSPEPVGFAGKAVHLLVVILRQQYPQLLGQPVEIMEGEEFRLFLPSRT